MDLDPRLFATVFATVFVAELGDKTQLATLLYAADRADARLTVFVGGASALVVAVAVGVAAGALVSQWLGPRVLRWVAGLGFIAVGLWVLVSGEGG